MVQLGLPIIDRTAARRLSLAGRAVIAGLKRDAPQPPQRPARSPEEALLAEYLQAKLALEIGEVETVSVHRPGFQRNAVYTRSSLPQLEQAIAQLRMTAALRRRPLA